MTNLVNYAAMTLSTHLITAEELWQMPNNQRRELVRGEIRTMAPAGFEHGAIEVNVLTLLAGHVKQKNLGVVVGGETGFVLARNPDVVRGADIAFVRRDRIPTTGFPVKFWEGPPDLAIEIISPSDTLQEVEEKVDDYLNAGTRMVWVINPRRRTVTVSRAESATLVLRASDLLDGQDVVPGFSCKVADIFA